MSNVSYIPLFSTTPSTPIVIKLQSKSFRRRVKVTFSQNVTAADSLNRDRDPDSIATRDPTPGVINDKD